MHRFAGVLGINQQESLTRLDGTRDLSGIIGGGRDIPRRYPARYALSFQIFAEGIGDLLVLGRIADEYPSHGEKLLSIEQI
jgi:hypothetical protein